MGDDGGTSFGESGGGFGDSSGGFGGSSGGFGDSSGGFNESGGGFGNSGGGFADSSTDKNDTSNSFSGKDNGTTLDSRYKDDDIGGNDSHNDNKIEHHDSQWKDYELNDEVDNSSSLSARNILSVVGFGSPEDKTNMNGDAVMSPMLFDESNTREDRYPERNTCKDCIFETLVCCDCSIL